MEKQYEIGRAIRKLGKEDILVIGSGNKDTPKLLHQSYAYGTLSYICLEF
jgi:aromatic ring-opening dioxygenase catalytic subunit (LigB family)